MNTTYAKLDSMKSIQPLREIAEMSGIAVHV